MKENNRSNRLLRGWSSEIKRKGVKTGQAEVEESRGSQRLVGGKYPHRHQKRGRNSCGLNGAGRSRRASATSTQKKSGMMCVVQWETGWALGRKGAGRVAGSLTCTSSAQGKQGTMDQGIGTERGRAPYSGEFQSECYIKKLHGRRRKGPFVY